MEKIEVREVFKVFGKNSTRACQLLMSGVPETEVAEKLKCVPAVIDASFSVASGELFVVMGLSGSGKSTVVRCINRLHKPTSGSVMIDGEEIMELEGKELRELRSRKVSMVFQNFALFPHRTILENTCWGLDVRQVPHSEAASKAKEALRLVGLEGWEESMPDQLSGGMKQRVGLARALATDTDILLMDEAFSALDPIIRSEMQDQLISLHENLEKTIIFITHDLNEAMHLGNRIAIMKGGRVEQVGTSEEILRNPATEYIASFVQTVDLSRILTAEAIMEVPVATILAREGPTAALKAMKERQVSALYVVGPNHRLYGTALDEEIIDAIDRGEYRLENILQTDVPVVDPETRVSDLFIPAAESILPLAVVRDGKLIGVIPRVNLLMALGKPVEVNNGSKDPDSCPVPGGGGDEGE